MNLQDFKYHFKTTALQQDGVESFLHEWAHMIDNNPEQQYPVLVMTPPKQKGRPYSDSYAKDYTLILYLFDQNHKEDGTRLTSDERDNVWHGLAEIMDGFLNSILADRRKFILLNERVIEWDEGHIGQDDLLWAKCNVSLRANDLCES